jgi:hypothetical protein
MKNPDGDDKEARAEYDKAELESLAAKKAEAAAKPGEDEIAAARFNAKEDYQVREALNTLKAFEIHRKIASSSSVPFEVQPAVQADAAVKAER